MRVLTVEDIEDALNGFQPAIVPSSVGTGQRPQIGFNIFTGLSREYQNIII
jgi:hypothetical protein